MTATATVERPEGQTEIPPARSARARLIWTLVGLLLVVAIVPALALSMIGSTAYKQLSSRHRAFMTPISEVTVEVSSGDITIEPGTGTGAVVATSGVHGLSYPTDDEQLVGRTLVIRSTCGTRIFNDRCNRNYVLHLPSKAEVTASSGEGDVKVTDMGRAVSAHSDQGDVTIAGGSGTVQASTGQGTVTVSRSYASSVSVQSGQGDATVDLLTSPNRVSAVSGQGDVTVEIPKGTNSYQVKASSGEGNVSDTVGNDPASDRVINASSGQGDVIVRYRNAGETG
jgi:Putative adhesin